MNAREKCIPSDYREYIYRLTTDCYNCSWYMVALQRDQYNPTSRVLKYRAKHDKSFYLGKSSEIDPDVTDISYDSDSKVSAYTQEQKRLSDDEIQQIAEKYSAGASTYELATKFGCHRSTISRVLKKSGI